MDGTGRVVGRSIDAVEGDTEKALLLGKLDSFQICNAVARGFAAGSCAIWPVESRRFIRYSAQANVEITSVVDSLIPPVSQGVANPRVIGLRASRPRTPGRSNCATGRLRLRRPFDVVDHQYVHRTLADTRR